MIPALHRGRALAVVRAMIRHFVALVFACVLAGCTGMKEPARQTPIAKVDILPLALDDDFAFTKVSPFFNDPHDANAMKTSQNAMIQFEKQRVNYGAVSGYDRAERYGYYYNVWWKSRRAADITVRFEYRQENLGSHVQAKETFYAAAKGGTETRFNVIGDEYANDGKVTAWRLLLIENDRIVGLRQSFLWN